jgi:hypothetical protein
MTPRTVRVRAAIATSGIAMRRWRTQRAAAMRTMTTIPILSFGSQPTDQANELADVVSTEGVTSELYVEGESDTYLYRLVFQGLVNTSLSPEDSQYLVRQTADRCWA